MLNFFKKNKTQDSQSDENKTSLKDRLFKSKKRLGDGLSSLLIGNKKIDDELLEDLEILLISSDIGIQTTDKIIESVRKKASRKELKDSDSIYELIKIELESLLVKDNLRLFLVLELMAQAKLLQLVNLLSYFKVKVSLSCLLLVILFVQQLLNNFKFGVREIIYL